MHELVKNYIEKKEAEIREKKEKEKQKVLDELGIFEKEYSETPEYSSEYPDFEHDEQGKIRRYRKKIIEVSDEEYEKILLLTQKKRKSSNNIVAIVLRAIAIITYIVGFLAGIVFGTVEVGGTYSWKSQMTLSWTIVSAYWRTAFIIGTVFLGFAEIISLLNDIKNKLNK